MNGYIVSGYMLHKCSLTRDSDGSISFRAEILDNFSTCSIFGEVLSGVEDIDMSSAIGIALSGNELEIDREDISFPVFVYSDSNEFLGLGLATMESYSISSSGKGQIFLAAIRHTICEAVRSAVADSVSRSIHPDQLLAALLECGGRLGIDDIVREAAQHVASRLINDFKQK